MAGSSWLHEVQTALTSERMSHRYRYRLIEELRDHLEDISEERESPMSTEALHDQMLQSRLGSADDIVQSAKANLPTGVFARRHPIVTYLVAPLPLLIVLWVAYVAALIGIVSLVEPSAHVPWHARVAGVLISGLAYVPTLFVVLAITWVAIRSHSKIRWWLAGALPVAILSALLVVSFRMPTTPGTGNFSVGFSLPPQLAQLPQFVIPMLVATAFMLYFHHKRNATMTPQ